jgi:hypothetical protein
MRHSGSRFSTHLALVHYPVYDKNHKVVATSVTNLDIHDIARACRTYGITGYHLVHPVSAQRELTRRIVGHWQTAEGIAQNESRSDALSLVRVSSSIEEVVRSIQDEHQAAPYVVATSAKSRPITVATKALLGREELQTRPLLLLFGTGWGLVEDWLTRADAVLEPIVGASDYNHLAVRTAVGIILDRLLAGARD